MKKPLITIITATYNLIKSGRKDYIIQNIMSVHNQSNKEIEHIIIDGASNDGTLELLKPYYEKGWIQLFSEPDNGIYDAMNKGIKKAKGEYIIILNSDDYLEGDVLSSIFEDKDITKYDCIFCGVNIINNKTGEKIKTKFPLYTYNSDFSYRLFNEVLTQGQIIKKNVYKDLKYYDTSYKIVADWNFFIKLLDNKNYCIKTCYSALSCFRLGGISDSQDSIAIQKHINERAFLINKTFPELTQEQANFAAVMQWRSAGEIKNYWQNFSSNLFSHKFIESLYDLILLKQNQTCNISDIFKQTKQDMINNIDLLPIIEAPTDNEINICLASDAGYEAQLYITIGSIIKKIKQTLKYHFYILDGGLSQKSNFYILTEKYKNIKIDFIDMKNQFRQTYTSKHISVAAYYRLAIFRLFAKFKRILYIDADSYLLDDIANLFNINMKDKILGASKDSLVWQKSWRNTFIQHKTFSGKYLDYESNFLKHSNNKLNFYFSSGVMLFDFSKTNVSQKYKKLKELLNDDYYCHDQDILNLLYNEKETYDIGREWNYFNIQNILCKDDYLTKDELHNYFYAELNPKLISFVIKPWNIEHENCDFSNLFWKDCRNSPYYNQVIQNMSKNKNIEQISTINKQSKNRSTHTQYKLFGCLPLLEIREK